MVSLFVSVRCQELARTFTVQNHARTSYADRNPFTLGSWSYRRLDAPPDLQVQIVTITQDPHKGAQETSRSVVLGDGHPLTVRRTLRSYEVRRISWAIQWVSPPGTTASDVDWVSRYRIWHFTLPLKRLHFGLRKRVRTGREGCSSITQLLVAQSITTIWLR